MIQPSAAEKEHYAACWEFWGANAQMLQLIEEMSELTTELSHVMRGRMPIFNEKMLEEYADVLICMEQVKTIMDTVGYVIDDDWVPTDRMAEIRLAKIQRGKERLAEGMRKAGVACV